MFSARCNIMWQNHALAIKAYCLLSKRMICLHYIPQYLLCQKSANEVS